MGALDEWRGLWRSIKVYRLDRQHARALDEMHREFAAPGDLVFDIGAHVGDRTASFRRLGARVVACEPQTSCFRLLRLLHGRDRDVILLETAVSDREGVLTFSVNTRNPTVSTLSTEFVSAANAGAKGWEGQTWDKQVQVKATTLDALIANYGAPVFVKVDVEGAEEQVLRGLSAPVPALSFEFTTIQRDVADACLQRCAGLGYRRFNLSLGESQVMTFSSPVDAETMRRHIAGLPHEANSGDIYALRDDWIGKAGSNTKSDSRG